MKEINIIYSKETPCRVDKFLSNGEIEELYSRTLIEKLVKQKYIQVNGKPIKKSYLLQKNDAISVTIPEISPVDHIKSHPMNLSILYEDDDLAIINKPAGITVHPAPGNPDKTIVNGLLHHFESQLSKGYDSTRPGIVHRLDKDTSGALIIAKNDKTHSLLSTMFQERKIHKKYRAVSIGTLSENEGEIVTNLGRDKKNRKKIAVLQDGKLAITKYSLLTNYDYFSYWDIELVTGRTHQIRVHFAHKGCPILGDQTYCSLKRTINSVPVYLQKKVKHLLSNHLHRHVLHAYQVEFEHPILKKSIFIQAPLPEDFRYTLKWLEKLNE